MYFPRLILRSKLTPADQIRKIKVNNDPAEALFGSVAGEQEYDRKISNTNQRWNNKMPLNNIYIYISFHPVNYEKNFVCCSSCCYYGLEVRACLTQLHGTDRYGEKYLKTKNRKQSYTSTCKIFVFKIWHLQSETLNKLLINHDTSVETRPVQSQVRSALNVYNFYKKRKTLVS